MPKIEKWICANWPAPKSVNAFATTRQGGHSEGPYQGLNLAYHVQDNPTHVLLNRQALKAHLNLPSEPVWLNQQHSDRLINIADSSVEEHPKADGAFTLKPGVVCVVLTADCLPVLLTNVKGDCVAALHCGWRGLLANQIEKSLIQMRAQAKGPWMAWFGPAHGPHFEIGEDLKIAFEIADPKYAQAITPSPIMPKKWCIDLVKIATFQLKAQNVCEIFGGDFCTYTQAQHFFSYRREKITGRMASLIWMAP